MKRLTIAILILLVGIAGCKKKPGVVNSTPDGGPERREDGAACTSDRGCDGEVCLSFGQGFFGGYCTTPDCIQNGCNGEDAQCVRFLDGSSLCMDGCEANADCRNGYRCRKLDGSGNSVCFPETGDGPPAGSIGSDCKSSDDCYGARDLSCTADELGGYCVGDDCGDCPRDSVCADWDGGEACLQECSQTLDCRIGYICDDGVCRQGAAVTAPFGFEQTRDALGVTCDAEQIEQTDLGTTWRVRFDVPASAIGYAMVPFVATGSLKPLLLTLPDGSEVDLETDYKHHNIRAREFQLFDQVSQGTFGEVAFDWPILVPYSPDRADVFATGEHELTVIASVAEPCVYVLPSEGEGTTLDLNVIFVGVQDYGAASAAGDPDLRAVFERLDEILGQANIRVGSIEYADAPREIAERYRRIRSEADLRRATAFGVPRGESLQDHLNVDVFLVEDLSLGDGVVFLGLSAGLPGPPGLHGNPANGLVFSVADLGVDNDFVAHIMAHELGHYLGLRHTTEVLHNQPQGVDLQRYLGTEDPLEDTPVCSAPLFQGTACPDFGNLMFPTAEATDGLPTLTDGQAEVLRTNPLIR